MSKSIVKSLGYGIMVVESIGSNSIDDDMKNNVCSMFQCVQEWVDDSTDSSRALLMVAEGTVPTIYELSQFERSDWEWMETLIGEYGSEGFLVRFTTLKKCRDVLESTPVENLEVRHM